MITSFPRFAVILVVTLLAAPFARATGSEQPQRTDSLYNRENSESAAKFPSVYFGPKASSYRYDKRMVRAAEIAAARARGHSTSRCWRYVKNALLAANVVESYPGTVYAKQAGGELQVNHGFKKIAILDPFKAPVGSVLVYGGKGAGHVEIRTKLGFVSDFQSRTPSRRPLIGVYVKPS